MTYKTLGIRVNHLTLEVDKMAKLEIILMGPSIILEVNIW